MRDKNIIGGDLQKWALVISDNGRATIQITLDGKVTIAPGVDVSEAARVFWDAVEKEGLGRAAEVAELRSVLGDLIVEIEQIKKHVDASVEIDRLKAELVKAQKALEPDQ